MEENFLSWLQPNWITMTQNNHKEKKYGETIQGHETFTNKNKGKKNPKNHCGIS